MATDGSRVRIPLGHDGRMLCGICAHETVGDETVWCELTSSFLCRSCCHGVSVFEPGLLVEAMSRAKGPLAPTEVASICFACSKRCASGPDARDPETDALPS